jgi:hypothetical protein
MSPIRWAALGAAEATGTAYRCDEPTQQPTVAPPTAAAGFTFGSSLERTVAACSAKYVFEPTDGGWAMQKLSPADSTGGSFGSSVAADGTTAVIGDEHGNAAFVFTQQGSGPRGRGRRLFIRWRRGRLRARDGSDHTRRRGRRCEHDDHRRGRERIGGLVEVERVHVRGGRRA